MYIYKSPDLLARVGLPEESDRDGRDDRGVDQQQPWRAEGYLNLRTTAQQKCGAVPRRARIEGS